MPDPTTSSQPPGQAVPAPSRRTLLAGAVAGVGAWAAAAVGSRTRVRAADDDPMLVGNAHTSSTKTSITSDFGSPVFEATHPESGTGISGYSWSGQGVQGGSEHGIGVYGNVGQGIGVFGNSNGGAGVWGQTDGPSAGVVGWSNDDNLTGVIGHSGEDDPPAAPSKTGVLGHAAQDSASRGVVGLSPAGQGVRGETTSGVGVFGTSTTGYAFRGSGRVRLERVSGVATIRAGTTSKTISPGVDVTTASFVLLTPKTNIGSRSLWFTTNATANTFTIRMSSSRSSSTKVAWLLLG